MNEQDAISRIIFETCEENGIDTDEPEKIGEDIDSVQYISTLVALEEKLHIRFPDYILEENIFSDMDKLKNVIKELLN